MTLPLEHNIHFLCGDATQQDIDFPSIKYGNTYMRGFLVNGDDDIFRWKVWKASRQNYKAFNEKLYVGSYNMKREWITGFSSSTI